MLMDWLIKEDKYRIQSAFSFLVKHSNSYSLEHHIVANRYTWPLERIINFLAPSCFTMAIIQTKAIITGDIYDLKI